MSEEKIIVNKLLELRKKTGAPMKHCIEALNKNHQNIEKSVEFLMNNSSSFIGKYSGTTEDNKNGIIVIKNEENKIITFSFKCFSDFVKLNKDFKKFGDDIANIILENFDDLYNKKKFLSEIIKYKEKIEQCSSFFGEKVYTENEIFFLKNDNENFGKYIHHDSSRGSFVISKGGDEKFLHKIAKQIFVGNPIFISKDEISKEEILKREKEIKDRVEFKDKSEKLLRKIINNKISNWISNICLLEQHYFDENEPSQIIREIVNENKAEIKKIFLVRF